MHMRAISLSRRGHLSVTGEKSRGSKFLDQEYIREVILQWRKAIGPDIDGRAQETVFLPYGSDE